METPNKKTIAYIIALPVPPLGAYLAVDMRHKWRHLGLIIASALLTMLFYPLGLGLAILIIYTQMPDEEPAEVEDVSAKASPPAGLSDPETGQVKGEQPAPQPIPGLIAKEEDQGEAQPVPQPIPPDPPEAEGGDREPAGRKGHNQDE